MFDTAEIKVISGRGGNGAVSFRREKFVPYGGPDGGDGGRGGSVIIKADNAVDNLRRYRQNKIYRAGKGQNGEGNRRKGKNGKDIVLLVPAGTIVAEVTGGGEEVILADLNEDGDEVVVAPGGKGGWGNTHFTSSTNQAPHIAQAGQEGEEKVIRLEMRLIADVGIIGYPNAGKSTLLTAASAARPKVADYPFTTIEPELGIVEVGMEVFILAEIPGLIEGAHSGKGLGHEFLRHAMRTKMLLHLVSGTSESPSGDMVKVNKELGLYDISLVQKPQIVAVNKIDLPDVQKRMESIKEEMNNAGVKAHYISAATGQGVAGLMAEAYKVLKALPVDRERIKPPVKIFRPHPKEPRIEVRKVGEEYLISAPDLERIIAGAGVTPSEIRWQLNLQLNRLGVNKALARAGAKNGDRVRCGEYAWEWYLPGGEE